MNLPEASLTPAMRQYAAFKKQHPDCVLLFRMGDFYETFYDDAVLCHRELGITLTERTKGVPMAGVPYHSVEGYLRRLIERGHRVALADQIQDPREAKGVVERAVTRVLTPGTLVDETLLDDAAANHIAAVYFREAGDDSAASVAVAELSTGAFELFDAPGDRLADELARIGVQELLHADSATGDAPPRVKRLAEACGAALTGRPSWQFRHAEALEAVTQHFGVTTLAGFGLADDDPAIGPAGALVRYLWETQAPGGDRKRLSHLRPPHRRSTSRYLTIDATSLRALEIERTMRRGDVAGSLVGVLQACVTPMGKRLLRDWLCFPLTDLDEINRRQDAVQTLVDDRTLARELRKHLIEVQDVARMTARLSMGRATPRDLVALGRSVGRVDGLVETLEGAPALAAARRTLENVRESLAPLAAEIAQTCVDNPPAHLREGGLIRDGVDARLDEARTLQRDANEWMARYQQSLIRQTGIPSLKVGFNKVFGYYIEVTSAHKNRVPETFNRKQTLKNAERFITPELKDFENRVLTAEQRAVEREQQLFDALCRKAAALAAPLNDYADAVAELDVLACFAERAVKRGYTRPRVVAEPILDVRGGRHPVLDELLQDRFVPNDSRLGTIRNTDPGADSAVDDSTDDRKPGTLALITGPNMAGKSTYIRQVALIALMAHTGSFVPAERAVVGLTDRIFTRIGASDELHAGHSTFMVEMTETANILHHATDRSLVVLDEIGRGTSTLDGLSLAWAIAEQLASIGARTLFATHYHELTSIADRLDNVTNLHVAVREWQDEIIFVYRILPGRTDRSYGIHVAKIAGVPTAVIERAKELLDTLEVQTQEGAIAQAADQAAPATPGPGRQMALFTEYVEHPVVEELRKLNVERLSPMEAFDVVRRLREAVDGERRSDGATKRRRG